MKAPLFQAPIEDTTKPQSEASAQPKEAAEPTAAPDVTGPVSASTDPIILVGEPENYQARQQRLLKEKQTERLEKFREQIIKAREPETKPLVVQPVAPRILEQTRLEMELGKKMNAHHAEQQASRPPLVRKPREVLAEGGGSTQVFRPHNYVPDPKKNQGQVQARTL